MPPNSQIPPSSVGARLDDCVFAVRKRIAIEPTIGVVLGSGLGGFAESFEGRIAIPYRDLPHMADSTVAGHEGNLCFGRIDGVAVVCMQGRLHLYEGHSVDKVVHGVRTMARLGARRVFITNAAGSLRADWSPGDLMLVTDHLNLTGVSPLLGPNDESIGPRFPDMVGAYDGDLGDALRSVARQSSISLREGVYAGLLGPQYETPAEVRMLRGLGADAVGMSTVLEVIALRHMGVRVCALSCLTNSAAGIASHPLDHADVEAVARRRGPELVTLLTRWIAVVGRAR
ncbi:MAG TPA: purine-nucleoside phosphorylase [Polyangiaceae bacterium]|nr:purine-nucleoside phosphorylase [Polyangiaceae bacterium]